MATITPKEKDGKIIAFKFRTCVGRDENGKQVSRATTWQVPENLSMVRLEKAAQRAAADWEKQARAEYEKDLYDPVPAPDVKGPAETGNPRHHPCGQLHFPRRGGDIRGPRPQRCDPPRQAVYESPRPARPLPPRSAAQLCHSAFGERGGH